MSNETVPLTEAKARLSEYADRVEGQHERVTVTRKVVAIVRIEHRSNVYRPR